jgi:hypothetical protein
MGEGLQLIETLIIDAVQTRSRNGAQAVNGHSVESIYIL